MSGSPASAMVYPLAPRRSLVGSGSVARRHIKKPSKLIARSFAPLIYFLVCSESNELPLLVDELQIVSHAERVLMKELEFLVDAFPAVRGHF